MVKPIQRLLHVVKRFQYVLHAIWFVDPSRVVSGRGLRNANYINFSASEATNQMQRMVNILDTVQHLLYFPNARNFSSSVRPIHVRDSEAVRSSRPGAKTPC